MTSEPSNETLPDRDVSETRNVSNPTAKRRLSRALTVYALGLLSFSVLAIVAHFINFFDWDLVLTRSIQSFDSPRLLAFMQVVSFVGNKWHPHLLTATTIIVLLLFRLRPEAAALTLSTAGGATLNRLIKVLVARPRPSSDLVNVFGNIESRSFPSGHVTFYVCYFGFLFFVAYALLPRGSASRRIALMLLPIPVILVGLSRVYLGAHWPSDTIGAYLFSGLWLGFSLAMYRKWKR